MDGWIDEEEEAADLLQSLHRAVRKTAKRTRRTREATGPDERNHDPATSMAAMNPGRDGRGMEGEQGSESCGSLKAWPNSSTHLCRFMAGYLLTRSYTCLNPD